MSREDYTNNRKHDETYADFLIRQAREMLEGVTEGPWFPHGKAGKSLQYGVTTEEYFKGSSGAKRRIGKMGSPNPYRPPCLDAEDAANARFIAWCREGVPALIAELEKRNG